ncbi:OmpA family protein [Mesorhizobium sp. B1-1-7]|uniref:OmpA family protein n=1 Tax=Mesorhizobium sp. B1-1-7 TaxID=2589977 RepID=UPI0015E36B79|nr:OmpA family protein [Mesorhizobium sp. B1-1-7]
MTDMTVGFLFIVILLLAFFASQYKPSEVVPLPKYEKVLAERDALAEELKGLEQRVAQILKERDAAIAARERADKEIVELKSRIAQLEAELERLRKPNPLEAYINNSMEARRRILQQLSDRIALDFPGIQLMLSEESLRFQGEGLFKRGESTLLPDRLRLVQVLANRLHEILPCYTLGGDARFDANCNSGFALIEAVQIEGHTDSDGDDMANLVLSTNRATTTFRAMTTHQESLLNFLNFQRQPVLSVAGYGRMRPIASNDTVEDKATNRRIDLRIIMYVPHDTDEIDKVRDALLIGSRMSSP